MTRRTRVQTRRTLAGAVFRPQNLAPLWAPHPLFRAIPTRFGMLGYMQYRTEPGADDLVSIPVPLRSWGLLSGSRSLVLERPEPFFAQYKRSSRPLHPPRRHTCIASERHPVVRLETSLAPVRSLHLSYKPARHILQEPTCLRRPPQRQSQLSCVVTCEKYACSPRNAAIRSEIAVPNTEQSNQATQI